MFKIPAAVLASLRDGKPSQLTPDQAKEVARYIDTLEALDEVPALLKATRDEVSGLKQEIKSASERSAQEARMQRKNQRGALMSFGWLGPRPFSTIIDRPLPAAVAASAIAAGLVFTVEIFTAAGGRIRVATQEFATRDTDSLPNTPFSGTLEKPLRHHRSIIDGSRIGGMASGYGEIVISNPSGEYDAYANSLDGAHVIQRMGIAGSSFDSFVVMYDGLVDGAATIDEDSMTLHVYDDNKRLEIPAQPSVYGGTGGIDGDANVKGKRKPISLGVPRNVSAVLIDTTNLVYQYNDGQVYPLAEDANVGVYDRGVKLVANVAQEYSSYAALIAATIAGGRYATCANLGLFRLGAKPDGVVTITAVGAVANSLNAAVVAGAYVVNTASAVHHLITISSANIVVDYGSVIAAASAQPAIIGYFIGPDENKTLRQAIDELMYGILGWAGFRRDRTFDMGLIALPTGSPLGDYTDMDFFTLRQLPLPSVMSPPPWRVRAAYSINWTIQPDIDATIDAGSQTLRKDPYSIAASTNSSLSTAILAAHPQAQDPEVWPSFFQSAADAIAFCNAVLTLFGGATRSLFELALSADAYALNLSNPIKATDDRYGLSGGALGCIVSIDDDTSEEQAIVQMVV